MTTHVHDKRHLNYQSMYCVTCLPWDFHTFTYLSHQSHTWEAMFWCPLYNHRDTNLSSLLRLWKLPLLLLHKVLQAIDHHIMHVTVVSQQSLWPSFFLLHSVFLHLRGLLIVCAGFEGVSIFVNDNGSREVLEILAQGGTKLLLLRSAGMFVLYNIHLHFLMLIIIVVTLQCHRIVHIKSVIHKCFLPPLLCQLHVL